MIAKDLDPFYSSDVRELAGRAAEEQMAFYLKRRFQDNPHVWVFNGLRFEHRGIVTQIDHLLLTTWGFFIVESKSVTTMVKVNSRDEWTRQVDGIWKGMASPIEQGAEQMRQLRRMLEDNAEQLLGKLIGLQKRFGGFVGKNYCAVSDNGIIERETAKLCPEAMKADQIARILEEDVKALQGRTGLKTFVFGKDLAVWFSEVDFLRTKDFLLKAHVPREVTMPVEEADKSSHPESARCVTCACPISPRVLQYCLAHPHRFQGRAYCMACQKSQ